LAIVGRVKKKRKKKKEKTKIYMCVRWRVLAVAKIWSFNVEACDVVPRDEFQSRFNQRINVF
jgi:hypothetical protein